MPRPLAYTPRLLRLPRAAAYCDVGETKFLEWVQRGIMPPPTKLDGCTLWDRERLDMAIDALSDRMNDRWTEPAA